VTSFLYVEFGAVFLENDSTNLPNFFSWFRRKHLLITTCYENTALGL